MHRQRRAEKTSWSASHAGLGSLPVGAGWVLSLALALAVGMSCAQAAGSEPARVPAAPAADCLTDPDCVALLRSAKSLSSANQPNAALTAYQQAYERSRSLWILINIGRIQQRLGRPADAIGTYRRYLDDGKAAQEPPEQLAQVRGYLHEAEQDLLRPTNPSSPQENKPIYKKWSFKKFFVSDGGGVLERGS